MLLQQNHSQAGGGAFIYPDLTAAAQEGKPPQLIMVGAAAEARA